MCASYKPELGRDCDDGNVAVHPGAAPVCGDNLDNGCAGDALSAVREALGPHGAGAATIEHRPGR